ncbi:MAG: ferritin family protein [Pseudomonadota bacterium]
MGFKTIKEILDFAIEKESEAAAFYTECAAMESMSGIKEMLLEFAGQEKKHEKMLKQMVSGGVVEGVKEYKLKWITDIKRSNFVVDLTYEPGMAYNALLMLAAKREEKALELYNQLLANAQDDASKKLFKVLCQEEAKHKLFLETTYDDYMAEMGD